MKDIVLVGFGGHAKSVADTIERIGEYNIVGYTDVKENVTVDRYRYIGTDDILRQIFEGGVKFAAVCIGYMGKGDIRDKLYNTLKDIGYELPVLIDPSAIVSSTALINEGTFIGKGAIVNAEACIGKMCIINSATIVEHEAVIGDYTHVAIGAKLCGRVKLEDHVFVGAGAVVIQGTAVEGGHLIKAGEIFY